MAILPIEKQAEGKWTTHEGENVDWVVSVNEYDVDYEGRELPATVLLDFYGSGVEFHAQGNSVAVTVPMAFLEALAEKLPELKVTYERTKKEWERMQK